MMLEKTCNTFIEELSSKAPVPGGGGASAYVGALGIALGSMVGNLTTGKKKYAAVKDDIQELLRKSKDLQNRLLSLVDRDAEVFRPLAEVYGLPAGTDTEKEDRDRALQKVLLDAARVPLEIAGCCLAALALLEDYALKGSVIAISDAGVGALFCKAALQGAGLNVLINARLMKDPETAAEFTSRLEDLENEGIKKANHIYETVKERLL